MSPNTVRCHWKRCFEQTAKKTLAWVTRWKIAIRTNEPVKKVDKRRITASEKKTKKYKTTSIRNNLPVQERIRSISRVTEYVEGKTYLQATFDNLEEVVMEKNDTLYGDAGND